MSESFRHKIAAEVAAAQKGAEPRQGAEVSLDISIYVVKLFFQL